MKCPKCGYISFDFNQICPKCNRDISAERDKLNIPPFRPSPPSLLGALTGEASETNMGLEMPNAIDTGGFNQGDILGHDDSQVIEAMDDVFKDSQDMEIEFESSTLDELADTTEQFDLSGLDPQSAELGMGKDGLSGLAVGDETEELSLDLEDLPVENPEFDSTSSIEPDDEELFLEPDVVSLEDLPDAGSPRETREPEPGEATIDLGDLSLDDSGLSLEDEVAGLSDEEPLMGLDRPDSNLQTASPPAGQDQAEELSLDLESLDLDLDLEEIKDK